MGDADEILALHREFDAAELRADRARLEALLSDDFLSIGEQGFMLDKARWIGRFDEFRYAAIDSSDVDVRLFGGTAIVRYVQHSRGAWRGQELDLWTRASQVWVAEPNGWRLAGIQFSAHTP